MPVPRPLTKICSARLTMKICSITTRPRNWHISMQSTGKLTPLGTPGIFTHVPSVAR